MIPEEGKILSILSSLEPLFQEAEEKGLWFYNEPNQLWFTPQELREYQEKGKCIWGPVNWKLLPPENNLKHLQWDIKKAKQDVKKAEAALAAFQARIAKSKDLV